MQAAVCCFRSAAPAGKDLLALTVPRVGVLRQAVWSEFEGIDWDNIEAPSSHAIWQIPAHRMKLDMGDKLQPEFGHDIPLSRQAIDMLRAFKTLTRRFEYVFTHGRSWRYPMTDASLMPTSSDADSRGGFPRQ